MASRLLIGGIAGIVFDELGKQTTMDERDFKAMNEELNPPLKMAFKDAPVGARFKYPNTESIWVKIHSYPEGQLHSGKGLIVQWNGNVEGLQPHCCFVDEEMGIDFDTVVELV